MFAMELWGLSVTTWSPLPERAGKLPEPLEYDTLQDGLVELENGQRHMVLQCLSCYQVTFRFFQMNHTTYTVLTQCLYSQIFIYIFAEVPFLVCSQARHQLRQ